MKDQCTESREPVVLEVLLFRCGPNCTEHWAETTESRSIDGRLANQRCVESWCLEERLERSSRLSQMMCRCRWWAGRLDAKMYAMESEVRDLKRRADSSGKKKVVGEVGCWIQVWVWSMISFQHGNMDKGSVE